MEKKAGIKVLDSATWDEFGSTPAATRTSSPWGRSRFPTSSRRRRRVDDHRQVQRRTRGDRRPKDSPAQKLSDLKGKRITTFTTESDALLGRAKKLETSISSAAAT